MTIFFIFLSIILYSAYAATYKVKSRRLMWFLIIGLPLLFIPLALVPVRDPMTLAMVWMPVYPYFIGSFIVLISRSIKILAKSSEPMLKIKLVRPLLIIFVFMGVFAYHKTAKYIANQHGINLAKDVQTVCEKEGLCPALMEGWEHGQNYLGDKKYYSTNIWKMGICFPLRYYVSDDRKDFTLRVIHGFNMSTYIGGGVGKELEASYSDEVGTYDIPIE